MISYAIDAATIAGIFVIASMGLYVLTALTGQVSLAQATFMGVGTLVSSYIARSSTQNSGLLPGLGLAFPEALIIGALITGLLCAFFGFAFIKLRGAAAISASIASAVIILYVFERLTFLSGGSKGATSSNSLNFGNTNFAELSIGGTNVSRELGLLILTSILLVITYVYVRNISISPLGRAMRTVRERDGAAQTCAISPTKTIVSAYFICGLTAGVAGALYAQVLQSFEFSSSNPWLGPFSVIASMQLLAFLVVSGMKKLHIAVLVVFFLTFASRFFARAAGSLELFDSSQGARVSPGNITALISSVLVLVLLIWTAKTKQKQA